MMVEFDPDTTDAKDIMEAVDRIGYKATPKQTQTAEAAGAAAGNTGPSIQQEWDARQARLEKEQAGMKREMWWSIALLVPLMAMSMGPMVGLPILTGHEWGMVSAILQLTLTTYILFFQRHFFIHGLKALMKRAPNMDSLVAIGAGAAYVYGLWNLCVMGHALSIMDMELAHQMQHSLYFESAATIVTLVSIGKYLEARSKAKTGDALGKLVDLAPKTATLWRDGQEVEVNASDILAGDIVIMKPGQSVPVDGVITQGEGTLDQAAITGESVPVEKTVGDSVMTATINTNGTFRFRATKVGNDTTLAQIIRLVDEAGSTKAPIARLADKVAGVFVPVVIGIALVTLVVWLVAGKDFAFALSAAISVLVISCPCALGLATPVAIMVGTGKAAEYGILVKSAEALETLHEVNTIVLDKTGTITSGKPAVQDIVLMDPDLDADAFLQLAASIESGSEHPLAKAVKALAKAQKDLAEGRKDEDYMRFLLTELSNFRPKAGEDDTLQQQCDMLEHAQDIKMALMQGYGYLSEGETPVTDSLRQVRNLIMSIQKHFPMAEELLERIESCRIELQDIAGTLESEGDNIECDPELLETLQSRLNTLYSLEQKHHVNSSDELVGIMNDLQEKLDIMDNSDEHLKELQKQEAEARRQVDGIAAKLTELRKKTAKKVEKDIVSSLKTLGMPNVRFQVSMAPTETPTPQGMDKVSFLFSANLGSSLQNISSVASGGETARVMLSLKAMLSGAVSLPTIIFDEIDTGVSGHIAESMAHIMRHMGEQGRQVISITHLPQIAALGQEHYKVWKEDTDNTTFSHITHLNQQERVAEIANMLSGSNVSPEAINNAKALLGIEQ